ncbi:hypothetical protein PcaKH35_01930 [Parageobacillus caldoxylosilyticus]|nr:hypothetical protein PcaKH35_01930 [Parageobacillus caldoxylosilyticus]
MFSSENKHLFPRTNMAYRKGDGMMGTNWEIKSFNFVTWDWSKDVETGSSKA